MYQKIVDEKFHFISIFNPITGAYVRTGITNDKGLDTGVDPFMASFPHLIDVGIMGNCIHGKTGLCAKAGIGCYQSGQIIEKPNMLLEDFREIARQSNGRVNQFALGGRGDPDQHEHFEEILRSCRENNIVPNYTTSGFSLTKELAQLSKQYCGAVAVSWYRSSYTLNAISQLLKAGVRTNVHFILGKNSIGEALTRLKDSSFPDGINSVVFLLHKPVGLGKNSNVLSMQNEKVEDLFRLIDQGNHKFKVGMDSCSVPGIVNLCKNVIPEAIDPCEGGRFSCYIGADLQMLPCSFDQQNKYAVSLREYTIEQAWNSSQFNKFRSVLSSSCPNCAQRGNCLGGCPLLPEIVLCNEHNPL